MRPPSEGALKAVRRRYKNRRSGWTFALRAKGRAHARSMASYYGRPPVFQDLFPEGKNYYNTGHLLNYVHGLAWAWVAHGCERFDSYKFLPYPFGVRALSSLVLDLRSSLRKIGALEPKAQMILNLLCRKAVKRIRTATGMSTRAVNEHLRHLCRA